MGVYRLDSFSFIGTKTTADGSTAPVVGVGSIGNGNAYIGPVNGFVSVYFAGTLASAVYQLQAWDGTQWNNVGASVTTAGVVTTQIVALGLRCVVSGSTAGSSITIIGVLVDWGR